MLQKIIINVCLRKVVIFVLCFGEYKSSKPCRVFVQYLPFLFYVPNFPVLTKIPGIFRAGVFRNFPFTDEAQTVLFKDPVRTAL